MRTIVYTVKEITKRSAHPARYRISAVLISGNKTHNFGNYEYSFEAEHQALRYLLQQSPGRRLRLPRELFQQTASGGYTYGLWQLADMKLINCVQI
jgi:hypothetical protein